MGFFQNYLLLCLFFWQSTEGLAAKSLNANLVALLRKSDKKLIAIPVLFVLLRMWGTLQFFYSLAVGKLVSPDSCTSSKSVHDGFIFFGVMQVENQTSDWLCELV